MSPTDYAIPVALRAVEIARRCNQALTPSWMWDMLQAHVQAKGASTVSILC